MNETQQHINIFDKSSNALSFFVIQKFEVKFEVNYACKIKACKIKGTQLQLYLKLYLKLH